MGKKWWMGLAAGILIVSGLIAGCSSDKKAEAPKHGKMKVLSISAITNMAAGILEQPLNHVEVLEMGEKMKPVFKSLVDEIIANI